VNAWRDDSGFDGPSGADGGGPRRYASPLIAERRARILDEAKTLIGEVGAAAFTLRDLGRRANVSVTTIYNIFGDKEGVIAHALREFHAGIKLALPSAAANLPGYLRALADTTAIVIEHRAYSLALADLYFSVSLAPALFDMIRTMPLQVFSHWLWAARRDDLLGGHCDAAVAESSFANLEWATIKDWGAGRIVDAELAGARQRSFLLMVAAVGGGEVREQAAGVLRVRG